MRNKSIFYALVSLTLAVLAGGVRAETPVIDWDGGSNHGESADSIIAQIRRDASNTPDLTSPSAIPNFPGQYAMIHRLASFLTQAAGQDTRTLNRLANTPSVCLRIVHNVLLRGNGDSPLCRDTLSGRDASALRKEDTGLSLDVPGSDFAVLPGSAAGPLGESLVYKPWLATAPAQATITPLQLKYALVLAAPINFDHSPQ